VSDNWKSGDAGWRTPSALWLMVLVSVALHVLLVAAVTVLAKPAEREAEPGFSIALDHPPLLERNLPPVPGNIDAGPLEALPQQPRADEPRPEERESGEPQREEEPPADEARDPGVTVISARGSDEEREPEPEPEPEPQRSVRENLEGRDDVFSSSREVGGGRVSRHVAVDGDAGGGSPDLYRYALVTRIGEMWDPLPLRLGEVKTAVVEFTIVSPPLPPEAVNQVRTASVTGIRIAASSGDARFDGLALEAVRRVRTWPPLPQYYTAARLVVSCTFYLIGESDGGGR